MKRWPRHWKTSWSRNFQSKTFYSWKQSMNCAVLRDVELRIARRISGQHFAGQMHHWPSTLASRLGKNWRLHSNLNHLQILKSNWKQGLTSPMMRYSAWCWLIHFQDSYNILDCRQNFFFRQVPQDEHCSAEDIMDCLGGIPCEWGMRYSIEIPWRAFSLEPCFKIHFYSLRIRLNSSWNEESETKQRWKYFNPSSLSGR